MKLEVFMENNRSKNKAALYAVVYNKILRMIQDGLYPENSKLPSEPLLAEQMEVSRSTLRQALKLLQEDGIIEAKGGVGNFVRKVVDKNATGLEKLENPLFKSTSDVFDLIDLEVIPGTSTDYTEHIFQRKMSVVLGAHRFYQQNKKTKAYCFSHIATDFEELTKVDLNDKKKLLDFLESDIYTIAHFRKCEIRVVELTDNLNDKNIENNTNYFQMIREKLYNLNGEVVIVNKFYIPIKKATFHIYSYQ